MSILLIFLIGGLLTFGMRFSFIYLLGRMVVPESFQRALKLVAPAVLSAIVVPELLLNSGAFNISLANDRLIAGVIAFVLAWWTKNTLFTILVGFVLLLALQLIP